MPSGPSAKVADEISGLMVDLLGPGDLTASKRQAFVDKLLKDDQAAHTVIASEARAIEQLKGQVAEKAQQVQVADARADQAAQAAGSVADQADGIIHEIEWCVVGLVLIFGAFLFLKFTVAGASVLAKF